MDTQLLSSGAGRGLSIFYREAGPRSAPTNSAAARAPVFIANV